MKRKTLLCCMLVLVFCLSAVLLVACNKGISDEILGIISQNVYDKHKNDVQTAENYTLPAVSVYLDADDKEYTVNLKWEISGTTEVKIGELDGKFYPVTVPAVRSEDINYKLKVTLVDENQKAYADKEGKEYSHTFDRVVPKSTGSEQESSALEKATVKNPVAGTAYKWVTFFNYEYRYFGGEKGGSRLTTVDSFAASPDVFVENATGGGYYLYFMKDNVKTYINMDPYIGNDSGDTHSDNAYISTGVVLTTETANLIPYKIHESGALYVDAKKTCSHGVELSCSNMFAIRDKYPNEIASTVAVSYFTDNNKNHVIMVNECPMFLVTEELKVEQEDLTTQQILDRAFALGANEAMDGKWTLEGTVTAWAYSASYKNGDGKMTVLDKEITLFRLAGSEAANIAVGDKIRVKGILENHTDGAVNEVRFKSGASCEIIEKAPVEVPSNVDRVDAPVADTAYLIAIDHEKEVKQLYLLGEMDSYYVATSNDRFEGVKYYVEASGNGFKIYRLVDSAKKYLGVTTSGDHVNLSLDQETVWTIDNTGIHVTVGEGTDAKEYYIGVRGTYTTAGMYTDGDSIWKAYLGTLKTDKANATITVKEDENATITVDKTTAAIGETVTITVTPKNDYTLNAVYVNGKAIEPVDGVYSFVVEADSEVSVILNDPSGEAPKGTQANPYTVAEAIAATPASGYSEEVWVEGFVVSGSQATTPKLSYNQWQFYLSDTVGGTSIQIRYANHDGIEHLYLNDKVLVKGLLTKYKTEVQMAKSNDIANSNPTLVSVISRGDASIKVSSDSDENATVTFTPAAVSGVVNGKNGDEVTFVVNVSDSEKYEIVSVVVGNEALTAVDGVYSVILDGEMEVTVALRDKSAELNPVELTVDFTDKYSEYSSSWTASYDKRTLTGENVGLTHGSVVTMVFSAANKQNSGAAIDNMPVMASKQNDVTFAISVAGEDITSVSISLKEWSNSKKLAKLILQYTVDGTTWVDCPGGYTGTAKALSAMTGFDSVSGTLTLTCSTLPEGVKSVRILAAGDSTSNQQFGIAGFKVVVLSAFGEASTNEAKIGNTEYPTLEEAITAAKAAEGKTVITLLKDVTCGGIMFVSADAVNVEFDLNGHTLTVGKPLVGSPGTVSQSLHFEKGNTVVIKNGTIACENNSASMLLQNYCDLTLDGVTLDGSNLAASGTAYTLSNNCGTILIKGGSVIKARATNGVAFDLWYGMNKDGLYDNGVSVTVEAGCTINGKIEYGAASRVTGTDWIEKTVLVLPEGEYTIEYTCNLVTNANANITIGGVKIGEVSDSEASNA